MRILYHHRTRAEDAQGIHIQEMVSAFRELGHEVEVVGIVSEDRKGAMSKSHESLASRFAAKLPPFAYEFIRNLYNFYGLYLLIKRVRKFRPHFIYERYALYNIAGILVSKLSRVLPQICGPWARVFSICAHSG